MSSFFEDLGRKLGRAAVPTYRKSKWIWNGLTGTEGEAMEAENELGETLAAELRLAIGLPGGYLFVSRSLIEFCEGSVDEVAFVIAHETAHVVRRHTWDRMIQQSALRAASFAAGRAGILSGWVRQQGLPMLRSAHSKDFEFEADLDGIGLVRAAGYDPNGAISFLEKIERLGVDPEVLGEYLASHPAPEERISRLKSLSAD